MQYLMHLRTEREQTEIEKNIPRKIFKLMKVTERMGKLHNKDFPTSFNKYSTFIMARNVYSSMIIFTTFKVVIL
jgi:hypothetical protein